ncbi:sensor histidine kinase [Arthrobacter sp. 35W]|uniref:sensor histidine kinase n=1 Tax=Arthrobacter sp. 35W TaxID=1132441 RepID=UPI00041091C5|nr:ATP-binding protein [Arthrobacter sp. 35W]
MAPRRATPRISFSARILLAQLAVLTVVVVLCAAVFTNLAYQRLGVEAEQKALAVARTVAALDDVRAEAAQLAAAPLEQLTEANLAAGPLQRTAEEVRVRTDALFVVVTDEQGLRLAHPNPALLGKMVSTDPSEALAGRETTAQEQGTLGHSARAKVPVFAPGTATVVGEVSVGISSEDVLDSLAGSVLPIVGAAALALGLGALASYLLGRRLKSLTLGLEPEEMAALAQDQEAVLRGVDEGVIGVSAGQRITVFNREAKRLLGLDAATEMVGTELESAPLSDSLAALLPSLLAEATPASGPVETLVGSRMLIVSARAVQPSRRPGTDLNRKLGWVVMLRDRTELASLTRQLDAVGALSTALRAQRHEFANRLHTVSGLLALGDYSEATGYVHTLIDQGPLRYPAEGATLLQDPYLQAFVGAKSVQAQERGVSVRIGPETLLRGRITDPQDATTVIGNLLDNAVRAAVQGSAEPRWVEIELLDDYADGVGTLHVVVADSGDGMDAGAVETAANDDGPVDGDGGPAGPVHGGGFGLPLVRSVARRRGGDVWIAETGTRGGPGAVVCARLPGVVEPLSGEARTTDDRTTEDANPQEDNRGQ